MKKIIICDQNKELIEFLKANIEEGGVKEIFACRVINGKSKPFKVIGTVYIGTVLEKMKENKDLYTDNYGNTGAAEILIRQWEPLGFTRSLKDIFEASGWEETTAPWMLSDKFEGGLKKAQILKSPEANALFSFLLQIGF